MCVNPDLACLHNSPYVSTMMCDVKIFLNYVFFNLRYLPNARCVYPNMDIYPAVLTLTLDISILLQLYLHWLRLFHSFPTSV